MLRIVRLITALVALVAAAADATAQTQAITINSKLDVYMPADSSAPSVNAFASVVLLAGGNGVLNLTGVGAIREFERELPDPICATFP